ncbi:UNVERIFIED_CONTAM: copper amine oxidase-like protein [Acetivibrio alkalicellulosi]
MKKIICGLIAGVILSTSILALAAANQWVALSPTFQVFVRGSLFQPTDPVVVVEGRTYLPLRAMGDALGVPVEWNAEKRQVEVDMTGGSTPTPPKVEHVLSAKGAVVTSEFIQAKPGETVEVPVMMSNVPSRGINGLYLRLLYDNNLIDVTNIKPGDIINDPDKDFAYNVAENTGTIVILYTEDSQTGKGMIDTDGVFMTLEVKVKDNALSGTDSVYAAISVDSSSVSDFDLKEIETAFSLRGVKITK